MDRERFVEGLTSLDLPADEALIESFDRFEADLYALNEHVNLTRVPRDECWIRHFLDSLLFHDLIPQAARVLDIGAGPGLPAWPLARTRPDLRVTALDANAKALAFLDSHPLPNLTTQKGRAEDRPFTEKFEVVTGRALAPLRIQVELSVRPATVGGVLLPYRSSSDAEAIQELDVESFGLKLEDTIRRKLGDAERLVPIFRKVSRTERDLPRKWSDIKAAAY